MEDLDRHIVDPMLQPEVKVAKGGDGWRDRDMARFLAKSLRIYRSAFGSKTDRAAARAMIRKLGRDGLTWKNGKLTAEQLLRMRYRKKT